MLQDEVNKGKAWLIAPFSTTLPMWACLTFLAVFAVMAYIVIDNLSVVRDFVQDVVP